MKCKVAWKYQNKVKRNSEAAKKALSSADHQRNLSARLKVIQHHWIQVDRNSDNETMCCTTHPRPSKVAIHASLTVPSLMTRWAVFTGRQTIIGKYTCSGKLIHSIWSPGTRARATVLGCSISGVTIPTIRALFTMITWQKLEKVSKEGTVTTEAWIQRSKWFVKISWCLKMFVQLTVQLHLQY